MPSPYLSAYRALLGLDLSYPMGDSTLLWWALLHRPFWLPKWSMTLSFLSPSVVAYYISLFFDIWEAYMALQGIPFQFYLSYVLAFVDCQFFHVPHLPPGSKVAIGHRLICYYQQLWREIFKLHFCPLFSLPHLSTFSFLTSSLICLFPFLSLFCFFLPCWLTLVEKFLHVVFMIRGPQSWIDYIFSWNYHSLMCHWCFIGFFVDDILYIVCY